MMSTEKEPESPAPPSSVQYREVDLEGDDFLHILHIGDIHFQRGNKVPHDHLTKIAAEAAPVDVMSSENYPPVFKAAAEGPKFHVCVVAGDVFYQGNVSFDATADSPRERLAEFCRNVTGSPPEDRLVVIPGNHDIPFDHEPNGERNIEKFIQFRNGLNGVGAEEITYPDRLTHKNAFSSCVKLYRCKGFEVALFGIDSTRVVGRENKTNIGQIGEDQMKYLAELAGNKEIPPGAIKIAVVHHDLVQMEDAEENCLTLPTYTTDAFRFRNWLRTEKFSLVLHAHQHRYYLTEDTQHYYAKEGREIPKTERLVYACSPAVGTQAAVNNGFNTVSICRDFFDVAIHSLNLDCNSNNIVAKQRFFFQNYHSQKAEIIQHLKHLAALMKGAQIGGGRQKEEILIDIDCHAPGYLSSLAYMESLGVLDIKESGEQFGLPLHKGDSTRVAFARALVACMTHKELKGMFEGPQGKRTLPFRNPYSLLSVSGHVLGRIIKDKNILANTPKDEIENNQYYHFCIIGTFPNENQNTDDSTDEKRLLLVRHQRWPMYLLPTLRKNDAGEFLKPGICPQLAVLEHFGCDLSENELKCFKPANEPGSVCPQLSGQPYDIATERGHYVSPSGKGIALYDNKLVSCVLDIDDTNQLNTALNKSGNSEETDCLKFSWMTYGELEQYKHITPFFQNTTFVQNLRMECPDKIMEALEDKYRNVTQDERRKIIDELLILGFLKRIFGNQGAEKTASGKFPDNLDVIESAFARHGLLPIKKHDDGR